ncbi:hypothetical protein B5C34_01990 [Pacificimonas flava]|uniref:Surface lipoprotein assembly modifier C-terminal domain-containing protein n=2 Tax=Pacificimonas TaxID=1960290 RepID=A0A219B2C9_9SPHN|nr:MULTISPECIES: tetratricopeptide repeat protein [Pacificimonas]MBZ6378011.1 DUF560 domain-containing protein [Pacificimonas aurantium]OWV32344.1 hypothetical protein B5C34_01990 [Pacificimonas flava]
MRIIAVLLAAGGCAISLAAPVDAAVDQTVQTALRLQAAGEADKAYELLSARVENRAGDPDFDYALGIAAADAGRPAEAIIALQRVLAVQPDNSQARAELARAYALGGDIDTARAEFDTALQDPSLPDPVRQRFDRIVRTYDRQIAGGGSSVSGFLDASLGYDTNVNAATDEDSIVIPLFAGFGPGVLGPGATADEDVFSEVVGGVSGVVATSRQARFFASGLANWRNNMDSEGFDQIALTGTVGAAHTFASRDVLSLSAQAQQFWLGGDSYRQAVGGILQFTNRLEGGKALSFSGEYFRQNFDGDPLRDSDRYGIGVAYAARTLVVQASGGHEETRRAAGDHLSFDYLRANAGVEQAVADGVAVILGVGGQIRRYDADDPLFLASRSDEQIDGSAGLKFRIADNAYVRPRVTYTRNWSNIPLYDYDRLTGSVGVRFEF